MSGFLKVIFSMIKSFIWNNRELIKKIVWDLLISIIKNAKEEKAKENESKKEEVPVS